MNYKDTVTAVDSLKALEALQITGEQQGAYIYFPCPKCGKRAALKAYGDKKNVWYCPKCKGNGNIVTLTMVTAELEYEAAKDFLAEKALTTQAGRITKELTLNYELVYDKALEKEGISEEVAQKLGIGRPKGKTMLSGCAAFTVWDEDGKKIAYFGMKGEKTVFHHSFNPELYLYLANMAKGEEVYITTDMFDCARLWATQTPAVCTFGLPCVSTRHLELLERFERITVSRDNKSDELTRQLYKNLASYIRVLKP